jgi:hypothetical protein
MPYHPIVVLEAVSQGLYLALSASLGVAYDGNPRERRVHLYITSVMCISGGMLLFLMHTRSLPLLELFLRTASFIYLFPLSSSRASSYPIF